MSTVITGIIARRRDFAMLQSIGMTNQQLQEMLIIEGISYVGIAGLISLILGSFLAWQILSAFNQMIEFFEYRFQTLPFLIILPMLLIVAVIGPMAAYRRIRKKSIVERLRETE
ncbi:MAG: FtsX-like permease family protein [Frisingicoccus sp.]